MLVFLQREQCLCPTVAVWAYFCCLVVPSRSAAHGRGLRLEIGFILGYTTDIKRDSQILRKKGFLQFALHEQYGPIAISY